MYKQLKCQWEMKSKKNYETNRTNIIDTLKEGERERRRRRRNKLWFVHFVFRQFERVCKLIGDNNNTLPKE